MFAKGEPRIFYLKSYLHFKAVPYLKFSLIIYYCYFLHMYVGGVHFELKTFSKLKLFSKRGLFPTMDFRLLIQASLSSTGTPANKGKNSKYIPNYIHIENQNLVVLLFMPKDNEFMSVGD